MPFHYMYYLAKWNVLMDVHLKNNIILSVLYLTLQASWSINDFFCCNNRLFGVMNCSKHKRRKPMFEAFQMSVFFT